MNNRNEDWHAGPLSWQIAKLVFKHICVLVACKFNSRPLIKVHPCSQDTLSGLRKQSGNNVIMPQGH